MVAPQQRSLSERQIRDGYPLVTAVIFRAVCLLERERYAWDWALRLRLQWPDTIDAPLEELLGVVRDSMLAHRTGPEPAFDVLRALREYGLPVDPYQYTLELRTELPRLSNGKPDLRRLPVGDAEPADA